MHRLIIASLLLLLNVKGFANKILVANYNELTQANIFAAPGDTIVLKNGTWNNVLITLDCNGTKNNPIYFIAETIGKVIISGNSSLQIAGNYLVVDGWLFTNGFAGNYAVITFKNKENKVANNCRVTNTAINNYNNYQRLQENYWIALYGKNNQIDHCYFLDKKNIGVLLAVILDDDKSRENKHIIQFNYFGKRLPLASNGKLLELEFQNIAPIIQIHK
jgi:poly(beta-D-mannuronate) lyase